MICCRSINSSLINTRVLINCLFFLDLILQNFVKIRVSIGEIRVR